jgi:hypothetical protein
MERPPFRGHGTGADLAFVTQAGHETYLSGQQGESRKGLMAAFLI